MSDKKDIFWALKIPSKIWKYWVRPSLQSLVGLNRTDGYLSDYQKQFIEKLSYYKIPWNSANKKIVITQIVKDYSTGIKLAAAAHNVAKKTGSNIALYAVAAKIEDSSYKRESPLNKMYYLAANKTLYKIFMAFGGKIIHQNILSYRDTDFVGKKAAALSSALKTKQDVLALKIENILVGDLIYDTYLRFANKPTVDLNDVFLKKIITEALHIFYNFKEAIRGYKVEALVNSYTTYIHHGIPARILLNDKVPVYNPICGYISIVHRSLKEYPSHLNNHFNYRALFNALEKKEEIIETHKSIFEKRFSGVLDGATSYMRETAFSADVSEDLVNLNWNKTVVVLAHCFFDSPHIYRNLLFPDFYEWITFTLDILSARPDLTILVKQHPNGVSGNDKIFAELRSKYKNTNIRFIDKKTSQLQLIQSRPKAMITAYGTAASEFSYHGIPSLTVYDNPFTAYDFTYLAKTTDEYRHYLENIDQLASKQNKNEIIEYYYMNNFFFLKSRPHDFLSFSKYGDDTFSEVFLQDYLQGMDASYFKMLDSAIEDGFDLCAWEERQLKTGAVAWT